jgi:hypothetical protein
LPGTLLRQAAILAPVADTAATPHSVRPASPSAVVAPYDITPILRDVPFGENRERDVCRVVIEPSLIVTLMAVSGCVPRGTSPAMSPP